MLDSHPNISCGPETQFLTELKQIEQAHWETLSRFGVEVREWRARVAEFFTWIHLLYAGATGKKRWADKSPNYALILDYIDELFPDCQIVHIIRDPADVMSSYRQRWGWTEAAKAPRRWVDHVQSARAFGTSHPEDRYLEIRYEALVNEPEPTMRQVLEHLEEPWDDRVLQFGDVEHTRAGKLSSPYAPGGTSQPVRSQVYRSSVGNGSGGLEQLQKQYVQLMAGRLARELGY